jgi:hypothetical protein
MRALGFSHCALSYCAAAALLGGCGGLQPGTGLSPNNVGPSISNRGPSNSRAYVRDTRRYKVSGSLLYIANGNPRKSMTQPQ